MSRPAGANVSRTRRSTSTSEVVRRWSGTATDPYDPGSAAHHSAPLHAALRSGHRCGSSGPRVRL